MADQTAVSTNGASPADQATNGTVDLAQDRRDVLQGEPFMGAIKRVEGRNSVFVDVIEAPATLQEIVEWDGVYGTIEISMPTAEEPVRIELGGRDSDTSSSNDDQAAIARALERVQSSQQIEDRIADLTERYEERIDLLEEKVEHHKERAENYRDQLHEAEEKHREERRRLEEEHRAEIEELHDRIDSLREERWQIREQTSQSATDKLIGQLAEVAPEIAKNISVAAGQGQARQNSEPQQLPAGDQSPNSETNDDMGDPSDEAVPVSKNEVREGIIQGMLGTCVHYMQGQIDTQEELATQMLAAKNEIESEYGVELGQAGWIEATNQLAQLSIQQDWPVEDVADMVEPIAREFAPEGSMADTVLRTTPPSVAANQLLSLVNREVPDDVQSLIEDVLGILKNRL
jgi:hypothetical protein